MRCCILCWLHSSQFSKSMRRKNVKHLFSKIIVCLMLLALLSVSFNHTPAYASGSLQLIRHSTPHVELSIKFGRIYVTPNHVTCLHTAHPCFILTYVSNDGPRSVWLNQTQEFILQPHQVWPFTFTQPGIEKFTLFHFSPWWKLLVTVS